MNLSPRNNMEEAGANLKAMPQGFDRCDKNLIEDSKNLIGATKI